MRTTEPTPTAPVVGLLGGCRPAAILRGIAEIVVNAVKGMPDWSWSHVLDEELKIAPTLTYGDTSRTVIRIGRVSRVRTASPHRRPGAVVRVAPCSSGLSMRGRSSRCHLVAQATATATTPAEHGTLDSFLRPAVASTKQCHLWMTIRKIAIRGTADHEKPTESLAGEIVFHIGSHDCILAVPPKVWRSLSDQPVASYAP